jgi:soluble lytic murein transglycosylase-like protein
MKHLLIASLFGVVLYQTAHLSASLMPSTPTVSKQSSLRNVALKSGLPDPGPIVLTAVEKASKKTGLSQEILLSLAWTESSFNLKAVSSKNYYGLFQIEYKIFDAETNALVGSGVLMEKLAIAKGDYRKALILYKGYGVYDKRKRTYLYDNKRGQQQADKVLELTRQLKRSLENG